MRHCVRWETCSPSTRGRGTALPILAHVLWPNGCMDQGATWYWGWPRPRPQCVTWVASSPLKKGHTTPQFSARVCCDVQTAQATLCYMRTQLPPKGHSPQFSVHVCCGQMAGWVKIPFGTEVGLGLGDIVLNDDSAPLERGTTLPPTFRPMSIVAKLRRLQSVLNAAARLVFSIELSIGSKIGDLE